MRSIRRNGILLRLALSLSSFQALPASPRTIRLEWKSAEAREALARDRFVVHDREKGVLRLARSYLISHVMGTSVKDADRLGEGGAARVSFDLPPAGAAGAILYVFGEGGGNLEVNGLPLSAPDTRGHAGWAGREIPAAALRPGPNHFVFRSGTLTVDRQEEGRAGGSWSSRSFDGGATFRERALGPRGDLPGEYLVRLRVRGHPSRGSVLSPVIDLAAEAAGTPVLPTVAPAGLRLSADSRAPEGTAVRFAARFSARGGPPSAWTDWVEVPPGERSGEEAAAPRLPEGPFRYLQWRAELATVRADRTPELLGASFEVRAEVTEPRTTGLELVECSRPEVLPTFYPFTHQGEHPRVRLLREKHRLAEVVARGATELERQSELRLWVGEAWVERWDGGKLDYIPPWDALEILDLAPGGLSMGMCTHKAVAYVQAAAAVGYNARPVILSGHCLAEVWSNQLGRWVLQDPGPGLDREKTRTLGCRYDLEGRPASALEVHRAGEGRVRAVPHPRDEGERDPAGVWCGKYDRFGIPLRNDHLSAPHPSEEEHGYSHYRYDGYLWWSDDLDDPPYGEYSFLSNRAADFYPVLNSTRIELAESSRGSSPGTLLVSLRSDTPNLARYRVRRGPVPDGEGPVEEKDEPFPWSLVPGENRLEAAAVNLFGVSGPPSRILLKYEPPRTISTVAGTGRGELGLSAGEALEVNLNQPFGLELGPDGGLVICEVGNHRVLRLDTAAGRLATIAGDGRMGYAGDGGPAASARLNEPYEARFDAWGALYFVEMAGAVIRKVDPGTGTIRTIAGTGAQGFGGDGGPAVKAQLRSPHSIALDGRGGLYVADIGNHRIRRIDLQSGTIETIAGTGEARLPREGSLAAGEPIRGPRALCVTGNTLWIALREGHSVWKMDLGERRLALVAGSGEAGYRDGPARESAFNGPKGLAAGPGDDLYVADTENQVIRRIDLKRSLVETVAGSGPAERGHGGDGGPALRARLDRPHGIAVDPRGTFYIGDSSNHRVKRVDP